MFLKKAKNLPLYCRAYAYGAYHGNEGIVFLPVLYFSARMKVHLCAFF